MEHHATFHTERWSQAVVITTQGYLGSHRSVPGRGFAGPAGHNAAIDIGRGAVSHAAGGAA